MRSDFELPELEHDQGTGNEAVTIQEGDVDPVPESVEEAGGRRFVVSPTSCRVSYRSVGTFLIEDGQRVVCSPDTVDVFESKGFRRLVENEILAILLHQRGSLVLHASAVAIDGKAAIFLGQRGAGKSTIAAAFHKSGYSVLEDDVVPVRFCDGQPIVTAGVPELRLTPDTAEAVELDCVTPLTKDWGVNKCYTSIDFVSDSLPVGGCYVVRNGDSFALESLSGHAQLFPVMARTYIRGLLSEMKSEADHLNQCSQLVDAVPFRVVEYPRQFDILQHLIEAVSDDIRTG